MFGVTPGIFKNKKAAETAALAFSMEEKNQWIVVCKKDDLNNFLYRPCCKTDISVANNQRFFKC